MRKNKVSKTEAEKLYEEELLKEEDESDEGQTRIEELEDKE